MTASTIFSTSRSISRSLLSTHSWTFVRMWGGFYFKCNCLTPTAPIILRWCNKSFSVELSGQKGIWLPTNTTEPGGQTYFGNCDADEPRIELSLVRAGINLWKHNWTIVNKWHQSERARNVRIAPVPWLVDPPNQHFAFGLIFVK